MVNSIAGAVLALLLSAANPTQAASVDDGLLSVLAADKSIALAEAESDLAYLKMKLDDRFTFTDWTGTVRKKAQFLTDLPKTEPTGITDLISVSMAHWRWSPATITFPH